MYAVKLPRAPQEKDLTASSSHHQRSPACGTVPRVGHLLLVIGWLSVLALRAPAQSAGPLEPGSALHWHHITARGLLSAQADLKASLNCGAVPDVDDVLVFEGSVQRGATLLWCLSLEPLTLGDVFAECEVISTADGAGHNITLRLVSDRLGRKDHGALAYLLALRDDSLQVGATLPVTPDARNTLFVDLPGAYSTSPSQNLTCAEQAVKWCSVWHPPCNATGASGIGGIIGCAEEAACRNADCHNLACITNAHDCCERGYGRTYCRWEQWFTGGRNLEHVTCDVVYAIELSVCILVQLRELVSN